jgi:hypothetical protein
MAVIHPEKLRDPLTGAVFFFKISTRGCGILFEEWCSSLPAGLLTGSILRPVLSTHKELQNPVSLRIVGFPAG